MTNPQSTLVGLVVNPLAGLGGEVGLGGSDGPQTQARALELGGTPRAPERARRFVEELRRLSPETRLLAAAGPLGEAWAPGAEALGRPPGHPSTGEDTSRAAAALADTGVAVLVFVGGDGTARDVLRGAGQEQLCLGVPAGVKMHSGVFAVTPEDAAKQVVDQLHEHSRSELRDVVDLDEAARARGILSTSVYGAMRVPQHERMQRGKRSPAHGSDIDAPGLAEEVRRFANGGPLVFGPGTTVCRVAEQFGITPTLLGFDAILPNGQVLNGASGSVLEAALGIDDDGSPDFTVVLSPIGGQGFIIGRGNHQLTARILERLNPDRLVLVSDPAKLGELAGRLRIDAPSQELNERFRGHRRVWLGRGDSAVGDLQ